MNISNIVDNYINGNISDFKKQLKTATKKDLLLVIVQLAEHLSVKNDYPNSTYSDNGYFYAIEIVNKYL